MPFGDRLEDHLGVASIAANLLALPNSIGQQAEQARSDKAMLQHLAPGLGLTDEDINAMAPQPSMQQFPGMGVPILGSLLKGVGTTGQLLQSVLGTAPAPRPPLKELAEIAQARRQGRMDDQATKRLDLERQRTESENKYRDWRMTFPRGIGEGKGAGGEGTIPAELRAYREAHPGATIDEMWAAKGKQSVQTAGQRAEAVAIPKQKEKLQTIDRGLITLRHAKESARRILTDNPALARTPLQSLNLNVLSAQGQQDATYLIRNFRTYVPTFARAFGEVRPSVIEEQRLADAANFGNMTVGEAVNFIENYEQDITAWKKAGSPVGPPEGGGGAAAGPTGTPASNTTDTTLPLGGPGTEGGWTPERLNQYHDELQRQEQAGQITHEQGVGALQEILRAHPEL